jgi:hypothetical protein
METVTRSVRINEDVFRRLEAVCSQLGVNVNAYLKHAIGIAVARDHAQLRMQDKLVSGIQESLLASLPMMMQNLDSSGLDDELHKAVLDKLTPSKSKDDD